MGKVAGAGRKSTTKAGRGRSRAKATSGKVTTTKAVTNDAGVAPRAKSSAPKDNAIAKAAASPASASSALPDNSLLPATNGKVGVFGGPKDRGIKPDDKLALPTGPHSVYERVRSLNPKGYYCAMRWDYRIHQLSPEEGKRWWANKKLVVTNPKNNVSVVVRAVDYGPHENTGLDIGVSPGTADALGVEVGDDVEIAFADQRDQLGPR